MSYQKSSRRTGVHKLAQNTLFILGDKHKLEEALALCCECYRCLSGTASQLSSLVLPMGSPPHLSSAMREE